MLEFIIVVVLVYLGYYIWICRNYDKYGKQKIRKRKKKQKSLPAEFDYFIKKYNVDLEKINMRYFLELIGLVVAFDIAIVMSILEFVKIQWLALLLAVVLTIVISLTSFAIAGRIFKKKGLTKDEDSKRNRK